MIFICAQPATIFYAWQVEVMLDSFIRNGIPQKNIHVICSKGGDYYEGWGKMLPKYQDATFSFYTDTRENSSDVFSIRPNLLKQHWQKNPHLKDESVFYTDCDIVLTKEINWTQFEHDDVWYGSDCIDYISADPILARGEDLLDKICSIVDMDKDVVKDNRKNTIGAHYILKNIDSNFWEKVEIDTIKLFNEVPDINEAKKKEDDSYSEVPIYGDMWSLLWNGWKNGFKTQCHPDLSFCWAPRGILEYERHSIFHNAGIQNNMQEEYFYKYNYISKLPYYEDLGIKENTASYEYWKEIKKTGENTVLF